LLLQADLVEPIDVGVTLVGIIEPKFLTENFFHSFIKPFFEGQVPKE